jgi:hypothetical protein
MRLGLLGPDQPNFCFFFDLKDFHENSWKFPVIEITQKPPGKTPEIQSTQLQSHLIYSYSNTHISTNFACFRAIFCFNFNFEFREFTWEFFGESQIIQSVNITFHTLLEKVKFRWNLGVNSGKFSWSNFWWKWVVFRVNFPQLPRQ